MCTANMKPFSYLWWGFFRRKSRSSFSIWQYANDRAAVAKLPTSNGRQSRLIFSETCRFQIRFHFFSKVTRRHARYQWSPCSTLKSVQFLNFSLTKSSELSSESSRWERSLCFYSRKRCQERENGSFDIGDILTMMVLLKVYEPLYQNDEHEILFVLIIKSKFFDHF